MPRAQVAVKGDTFNKSEAPPKSIDKVKTFVVESPRQLSVKTGIRRQTMSPQSRKEQQQVFARQRHAPNEKVSVDESYFEEIEQQRRTRKKQIISTQQAKNPPGPRKRSQDGFAWVDLDGNNKNKPKRTQVVPPLNRSNFQGSKGRGQQSEVPKESPRVEITPRSGKKYATTVMYEIDEANGKSRNRNKQVPTPKGRQPPPQAPKQPAPRLPPVSAPSKGSTLTNTRSLGLQRQTKFPVIYEEPEWVNQSSSKKQSPQNRNVGVPSKRQSLPDPQPGSGQHLSRKAQSLQARMANMKEYANSSRQDDSAKRPTKELQSTKPLPVRNASKQDPKQKSQGNSSRDLSNTRQGIVNPTSRQSAPTGSLDRNRPLPRERLEPEKPGVKRPPPYQDRNPPNIKQRNANSLPPPKQPPQDQRVQRSDRSLTRQQEPPQRRAGNNIRDKPQMPPNQGRQVPPQSLRDDRNRNFKEDRKQFVTKNPGQPQQTGVQKGDRNTSQSRNLPQVRDNRNRSVPSDNRQNFVDPRKGDNVRGVRNRSLETVNRNSNPSKTTNDRTLLDRNRSLQRDNRQSNMDTSKIKNDQGWHDRNRSLQRDSRPSNVDPRTVKEDRARSLPRDTQRETKGTRKKQPKPAPEPEPEPEPVLFRSRYHQQYSRFPGLEEKNETERRRGTFMNSYTSVQLARGVHAALMSGSTFS